MAYAVGTDAQIQTAVLEGIVQDVSGGVIAEGDLANLLADRGDVDGLRARAQPGSSTARTAASQRQAGTSAHVPAWRPGRR